jgi:putative membrane protein
MGWGMGWWWIIGLFFIIAVIWFISRMINQNPNQNKPILPSKSALEIMKERYARGEIDKAEYEEIKRNLQ